MVRISLQKYSLSSNNHLHYLQPSTTIQLYSTLFNINHTSTINMRTSSITIFGLIAGAIAMPATLVQRQVYTCGSGTANCCDVDVLGVADLDCEAPPTTPTDLEDFVNICAAVGKIDMCCTLDLLDQGLLCSSPSNGGNA